MPNCFKSTIQSDFDWKTHDLHLIELVADDLWLVKNGQCKPYDGDLEDYKNLLLNTEPVVASKPKASVSKTEGREFESYCPCQGKPTVCEELQSLLF